MIEFSGFPDKKSVAAPELVEAAAKESEIVASGMALHVRNLDQYWYMVDKVTASKLEPERNSTISEVYLDSSGRIIDKLAPTPDSILRDILSGDSKKDDRILSLTWAVWLGFRVHGEPEVAGACELLASNLLALQPMLHGRLTKLFSIDLTEPNGTFVGIYPHVFMGVGKGPEDFVQWAKKTGMRGVIEHEGGKPEAFNKESDYAAMEAWVDENRDSGLLQNVNQELVRLGGEAKCKILMTEAQEYRDKMEKRNFEVAKDLHRAFVRLSANINCNDCGGTGDKNPDTDVVETCWCVTSKKGL